MAWTRGVLGVLAVGMAGTSQAFIMPTGAPVASKGKLSGLDESWDRTVQAGAQQWGRRVRQHGVTVVYMSRRRGGKGGAWQRRRRGGDAPPVEFDKYGFPQPPKQSTKELEEAHQKWFQDMEPAEGYDVYDPASDGLTGEDVERDPFLEEKAAEATEPTPAAAAAAAATTEGVESSDRWADYDNLPEWAGEMVGMDDPLDAPWRLKTEDIVRQAVTDAGFDTYDITWHLHHLNIDIANVEVDVGSPTSDQITDVLKAVEEALFPHDEELRVLQRFNIIIGTRGARDVLTTDREFTAFKGFEVMVSMKSPINESDIQPARVGRLVNRTPQFTTLNVQGRNVKIPTDFIQEVRLPPAKREADDFETFLEDDEWGEVFANGKVPKMLDVELSMPGVASWESGVQLVEGDWYEPPDDDELDGDDDEDLTADFDLDDLEDVVGGGEDE